MRQWLEGWIGECNIESVLLLSWWILRHVPFRLHRRNIDFDGGIFVVAAAAAAAAVFVSRVFDHVFSVHEN